jgi:hypothetical protein
MEINLPHKYYPRDYQLNFLKSLDNGIKRAVIVWNRRSGKDKTCFNYMVKKAFDRVGTYFYFLPTYSHAKKVIWDNIDNDGLRMLDHIPKELIKKTNATELKIELINGSVIQLIASDEFKTGGVGTNPIGVVFSEYSVGDEYGWRFASPILAANGGWAIFNFTPRGMNHAFTLLQQARGNDKWFAEVLTNNETKILTDEQMEEEKRNFPQDFIEQEWYCKFIEGAGAFFKRVRKNTYDKNILLPEDGDFQIGVDLAKYQDWTVLTPFNLNSFLVYPQERFNQIDWNLQKAKIEAMARRYNDARVWPDSTGIGDPIVEDLKARGLNIGGEDGKGFKFTETSRQNLLNNLAILLEQDKIKIPDDEGLISELESFRYELTERGKIKVVVPQGMTDDRVMSLALSVWGVTEPVKIDYTMYSKVYSNRMTPKSFE